jgi:formiminotetrahydrofolate cyclodeaminase
MEPRARVEQLDPFLKNLASSSPVPGGGSVAALSAAMGAALLVMVCNLTIGKKRYADVEEKAETARSAASVLLGRARELAEEDSRAYARVAEAMALPRATDTEADLRRERIQEALKGAAVPPLETMRVSSDVARLALDLVSFGNRSAVTDVGTASLVAIAAFESAKYNVLINVTSVHDDSWRSAIWTAIEEVPEPGEWNARVQAVIREQLEPA